MCALIKRFLPLAAIFVLLISHIQCIQVTAGTKQDNANVTRAVVNASNSAIDTELTPSERNRRLIPYMAFYLPAANLPINQQYATQRPKNSQQLPTAAVSGSGGLSPPLHPVHIPLPPAYMRIPSAEADMVAPPKPTEGTDSPLQHAHYQPSAGDDGYQALVYDGNEAIEGIQHAKPVSKQVPILHLLPPGGLTGQSLPHSMLKQKTVQHFPPIPSRKPFASALDTTQRQPQFQTHRQPQYIKESLQQQHHHHQHPQQQQPLPQYQRQRPKQSNFNLTPFTSSNTLPGHFIPIIYEPLNGETNPDSLNGNNDERSSVSDADEVANAVAGGVSKIQHAGNLINYNNANDNANPTVTIAVNGNEHQQKYIETTKGDGGDDAATIVGIVDKNAYNTPSGTYHVINEASPTAVSATAVSSSSSSSSSIPSSPLLTSSLVIQHQQRPPQMQQYRPKHPHFHPPKFEDFFESTKQQKYLNDVNMTPQERYVLYLQQRINYNKHQEQHEQQQQHQQQQQLQLQEEQERFKQEQQHLQHYRQEQYEQEQQQQQQQHQQQYQQQQMYFIDVTGRPVDAIRPIQLQARPAQEQRHPPNSPPHHHTHHSSKHTHPDNLSIAPQPQPSQPSPTHATSYQNYPQHSPISHAVFTRPELQVPPNHRPQGKPLQQVLHIPLHSIVNELNAIQQSPQPTAYTSKSLEQKYTNNISPSTPKYIDYIIEEPKQTLDDDEQQQQHPQQSLPIKTTALPFDNDNANDGGSGANGKPPQAAYIVIATSAPQQSVEAITREREHELYYSTARPMYKSSPTLHLHPVPQDMHRPPLYAPTRRPTEMSTTLKYNGNKPSKYPITTKLQPANKQRINNYKSSSVITPIPLDHGEPSTSTSKSIHSHNEDNVVVPLSDQNQLPDIRTSSLAEILHKLQASNHLPQTLTPDNIDNSIKTLITILNNLKHTQTIVADPPQYHEPPSSSPSSDYDYPNVDAGNSENDFNLISSTKPNKHPGPNTGRPGVDYPNYADIPQTTFDCATQRYKGFFGDPETNCQVWHYCDLNGGKASFLCPNGTIFSQIALTCDWWFNVKCSTTAQLYVLNERLYKYILPFTPKFPEDYSGPIVDKYLAMKFQEMEEKMKNDKKPRPQPPMPINNAVSDDHDAIVDGDGGTDAKTEIVQETTTANATLDHAIKHETINSKVNEQSSERNLLIDDEVDDISQRGTFDSYENATTQNTIADGTEIPLSLNPIVVVSSTIGPDSAEQIDSNATHNTTTHNDREYAERSNAIAVRSHPTESSISVEKVEVIEIKTDGNSGHLTPEQLYKNAVQAK